MFGHASPTALAMLAPQGSPDHAEYAEILFVKFPLLKELGHDGSLLVPAPNFGNETGVFDDGVNVEIGRQCIEHREQEVQNGR